MSVISLSRRSLLSAAGATIIDLALPRSAQAVGPAQGPAPRVQFIDMSYPATSSLTDIRKAGVRIIGRYYSRPADGTLCSEEGKILTKEELAAIEADKEMSVVTEFQYCNRCNGFGGRYTNQAQAFDYVVSKATTDATEAVKLAKHLKQPKKTPIYFGADFNPDGDCPNKISWEDMEARIKAYFAKVNEIVKDSKNDWKVGVYGFGAACSALKPGLAEYFWLSSSLSHLGTQDFFNKGLWHIYQNRADLKNYVFAPGVQDVDSNVLNPDMKNVGNWRSDSDGVGTFDNTAATDILARRFFLTKRACGYSDRALTKPLLFGRDLYGAPARIIEWTDTVVAATLLEGDTAQFYMKPSDIVVVGLKGNMPDWNKDSDKHFACAL